MSWISKDSQDIKKIAYKYGDLQPTCDISGTLLYVYLNQKYKNKVQGLCGNFNGISGDDMKGKDGIIDPTKFGDTWRTDSTCAVVDPKLYNYDPCDAYVSLLLQIWESCDCKFFIRKV